MDPISIGITAGSALLSGLSSLWASDAQAELEEKKKKRAQELLGRSIIDTGELDSMIAANTRRFNGQLQRVLNTSALRSRGLENSNVVGAAAAGEIAGQAAQSETQLRSGVQLHNESVFQQIASLEAASPTPSNGFEEFITGGISGAMAGMQISKGIAGASKYAGLDVPGGASLAKGVGEAISPTSSIGAGFLFNFKDYATPDDDQWWRKGIN